MKGNIIFLLCGLLIFAGETLHSADDKQTKTTEDLHKKLLRVTEKGYLDDFLRYLKSIPPDRFQEIINNPDRRSGENALLIAINELDPKRVYYLLQAGADPNFKYPAFADATPLLLLAAKDKEDKTNHNELIILQILLQAGANTEAVDSEKEWTALMHYARRRFEKAAEIMAQYDADISYLNKKKEGPLTVFGRDKKSPILKMLQKYNALPGRQERIQMKKKMAEDMQISLEDALAKKDLKKFLIGVNSIRDINAAQNKEGQPPLILAVLSGNPSAVEIVLRKKPDAVPVRIGAGGQDRDPFPENLLEETGAARSDFRTPHRGLLRWECPENQIHAGPLRRGGADGGRCRRIEKEIGMVPAFRLLRGRVWGKEESGLP